MRRAGLILLGMAAAFLAAEAALRTAGWVLAFRDARRADAATASPPPAGAARILCLGACYTVGVGNPPEDSYPSQLEDILNQRGRGFAVFNRGVRGQNLSFFVNRLEALVRRYRPRIIILNIGDREAVSNENMVLANAEEFSRRDRFMMRLLLWLDRSKVFRMARLLWAGRGDGGQAPAIDGNAVSLRESGYAFAIRRSSETATRNPDSMESHAALARAYAGQGLFAQAAAELEIAMRGRRAGLDRYRSLFAYRAMAGDFPGAAEVSRRIATDRPDLAARLRRESERGRQALEGPRWDPELWYRLSLDLGLLGEYRGAAEVCRRLIAQGPNVLQVFDLLKFYESVAGKDGRAQAGVSPSGFYELLERHHLAQRDGAPAGARGERMFYRLLKYDLQKARAIADRHGAVLLLENLGSAPEQQAVIRRVCGELSIQSVDLRSDIAAHPDRGSLYRPDLHSRLDRRGLRFVAERVRDALAGAGWIDGDAPAGEAQSSSGPE